MINAVPYQGFYCTRAQLHQATHRNLRLKIGLWSEYYKEIDDRFQSRPVDHFYFKTLKRAIVTAGTEVN